MFSFTEYVDVLTTPEAAFLAVADLMQQGHYLPSSVKHIKEIEPRPQSPVEQFLPGQKIAFEWNGKHHEHVTTEVSDWSGAEARILQRPVHPIYGEKFEWRLAELTPGMIRIELTFSANYSGFDKLTKGREMRKFWREALERLKTYLQEHFSFAKDDTFAPKVKK